LLTPSTVSYRFQRCMLSRWNSVQSAGEDVVVLMAAAVLDVWAYAEVLAAASINHSGAMASIEPVILREAVCFL